MALSKFPAIVLEPTQDIVLQPTTRNANEDGFCKATLSYNMEVLFKHVDGKLLMTVDHAHNIVSMENHHLGKAGLEREIEVEVEVTTLHFFPA